MRRRGETRTVRSGYVVFMIAAFGFSTSALGQTDRFGAWCGHYLIGSGPSAPRAATPTVFELARFLPRQCAAGDILTMTDLEGDGSVVAAAVCDYSKTITMAPYNLGRGISVTCAWIGGVRGSRPAR